MGIGVGWSIGANDAANSLGTAVGSRVITLKQAIILIAVFGFLGALLQGGFVIKTIGKGIVPMEGFQRLRLGGFGNILEDAYFYQSLYCRRSGRGRSGNRFCIKMEGIAGYFYLLDSYACWRRDTGIYLLFSF